MVFLLTLTIAQALGFLAEVSAGDWSSVLLKQEFHIAVGPNGYAFTAFLVMQLLSRLYATRLIDRSGAQRTIQWLGTAGTVGYLVCLFGASAFSDSSGIHTLVLACVAYAFLGVAVGPMPSVAFKTRAQA